MLQYFDPGLKQVDGVDWTNGDACPAKITSVIENCNHDASGCGDMTVRLG